MTFWTYKKTVFICLFLIVFGIPAIVFAATWWSYDNETNIVATDEFLVGSNTRGGLVNVLWSDVLSEIAADGTFQTVLTNEAGLYSALSDVSQFYEPGDLLQTEAADSPTVLDTDGQICFDNDDDRMQFRVGGSTYQLDFTGDAPNYVLTSNGSGLFTMQAASGTSVILDLGDDGNNESTAISEIATKNDTHSIFKELTADKLYVDVGQNWPTCDLATTATTANAGDSATAFFSSGTIEDARIASTIARDSEITATKLDDFTTPDDNTDLDASTTSHGLLPKLDNNSNHFLDGTGAWSTPAGGGNVSTNGTINADEIAVFYDSTTIKALTESEFKTAYNMEAGTDYQGVLSDEAGLYSALSDVSQFYEPGDLLRTENGNTPTAPSNDGEFVVDTDDEQFIIRVGGGNKNFDFTGDGVDYVFGSDGSGNFTLRASGAGDITSVLDDTTGAVPMLFQTWTAFSAADATPDVSTATNFRTVDTTTITDFDGSPVDGQFLYTYCGAATVFDLTASGLSAWNRSTDLTCTVGEVVAWKYRSSTGDWNCENCPDETVTLSSDGIVVNDGGVAEAVSMADNDGITWTNADGTDGNPTPTVAYPVLEERTITDPADVDDYYWFKVDGATTVSSVDCIAQGSTPSITVDVQECDSSGSSCASILSSVITCNGGNDAGTVSDSTLADNAWIYVALGAPSGTVSAISVTLAGTK